MAQIINTNIGSLVAQNNLNKSQSALQTSLERLSSGLRINSAKDDAAGLAIAERATTQIRGLNQAIRNANDGISLSQTAEGAMAEMTNNLQRIRELAVQSANSTNSTSDRAALDAEVQQRIAEINRIATQTSFNGRKVLDGTFGNAAFQIGANVGETISINLASSMKSADIGQVAITSSHASLDFTAVTATANGTAMTGGTITANLNDYEGVDNNPIDSGSNLVTINGTDVLASANYAVTDDSYRASDSAYAKAAAINASGINGVVATASTSKTIAQVGSGLMVDGATADIQSGDTMGYTLVLNGVTVIDGSTDGLLTSSRETVSIDDAITYINRYSSDTGVIASEAANGDLVLTAADGRNIEVQESWSFTDGATAASDSSGTYSSVFGTIGLTDDGTASDDSEDYDQAAVTIARGQITLTSSEDITISSGLTQIGQGSASIAATGSLEGQDVTTVANAESTIRSVDSALTALSNLRSTFGAIQNRMESTIANLSATAQNVTASRSRVLDADFAQETANLTRSQILQQAGISVLAQANALPQQVLSLLQ